MLSTRGILGERVRPVIVSGMVGLLCVAVLAPTSVGAQDLAALGLRAGAGIDRGGEVVYDAQIDLTDLSGSPAVGLAFRGFGEVFASKSYESVRGSRTWQDQEEMRVWGVALMADFLFRHSRETRGPYVALALGVGPLWVQWRLESTDPGVGDPLPGGGGFLEEDGLTVGSMMSAGLGQRLHRRVDLRAQATAVLVPSTDQREDLALIPLFTLTTGVRP